MDIQKEPEHQFKVYSRHIQGINLRPELVKLNEGSDFHLTLTVEQERIFIISNSKSITTFSKKTSFFMDRWFVINSKPNCSQSILWRWELVVRFKLWFIAKKCLNYAYS